VLNSELFLPLDRLVQCEAAVWTLDVLQGQLLPSATSRLDLRQQPQSPRTPRALYSRNHDQIGQKHYTCGSECTPAKSSRHQRDAQEPRRKPNGLGNAAYIVVAIV
jgi:hypothetical protein